MKAAGATIRQADLWFVVYGDLKQVDPAQEAARTDQKKSRRPICGFRLAS